MTAVTALVALAGTAWGQVRAVHDVRELNVNPDVVSVLGHGGERIVTLSRASQECAYEPEEPPVINCAINEGYDPPLAHFACADAPDSTAICGFSDLTSPSSDTNPDGGSKKADNFYFLSHGEIWGITWWGTMTWFDPAGPPGEQGAECTLDPDPEPPAEWAPIDHDNWTIRYYEDDNGLPGNLVKEFTFIGPDTTIGTYTRTVKLTEDDLVFYMNTDALGLLTIFEMNYTFDLPDRFQVSALTTYWVEIYSNYTHNECFFCWLVACPSVAYGNESLWAPGEEDPYELPYSLYDVAQCQDFCSDGPLPNPPRVTLERVGLAEQGTDCCDFRFTVSNENSPGAGPLTKFWMAVELGDGDECGADLAEIIPPVGWNVSYCEPWTNDPSMRSRGAIYEFDGGSLEETRKMIGHLKVRVNSRLGNASLCRGGFNDGEICVPEEEIPCDAVCDRGDNDGLICDPDAEENPCPGGVCRTGECISGKWLDEDNVVLPYGVRVWTSQSEVGNSLCGGGAFGPLEGPQGGQWSDGKDGICDIHPIPAVSAAGKVLLAVLVIGAGLLLVMRSRKVVVS